ncbi:MAG: SpoIIE family protein phosphatase [Leptospirales bacterium]
MQTRKLNIISDSTKGFQRPENRDGLTVIEDADYVLFFLFDGVSSYENSLLGVNKIIKAMEENHRAYFHNDDYSLKEALHEMHDLLCSSGQEGMYTTVCALYLPRDINKPAKYSHLGDSRIYKYANGNLTLKTTDHNLPDSPHVLTKCLGMEKIEDTDFYEKEIEAISGEGFLLCTDGFYPVLEDRLLDYLQSAFIESDVSIKKTIHNDLALHNSDDATYILVAID